MAAFEYVALDVRGKEKKGVLEADTARMARSQLRQQELTPLQVDETTVRSKAANGKIGSKSTPTYRGGIKTNELALFTRQVATLSGAGTPLEEALAAVSRQTEKPKIQSLILSRYLSDLRITQKIARPPMPPSKRH